MFDTLMGLPLFKGVSYERMSKTVGSCKFHFLKYLPGNTIFEAGEACNDVVFILAGAVRITIKNPDGRFLVRQTVDAPDVIAPDFLFGRHTLIPGTVVAEDTVSILRINKNDYITILNSDPVFLFNYLNLLSMNAQKAFEGILAVSTGEVAERIAYWISVLTQPRSHDIEMECTHRDLTALFGVPRTTLKAVLEKLKNDGLINYTPHLINVLDRRALLALLHNHSESIDD